MKLQFMMVPQGSRQLQCIKLLTGKDPHVRHIVNSKYGSRALTVVVNKFLFQQRTGQTGLPVICVYYIRLPFQVAAAHGNFCGDII